FRGLSKENVRQHVIDLQNKEVMQYFFKKTSSLLGKDYSKNSWMCERNILIPLYGEDNTVDRLLLRSSINPSTEPKEIQLILNPSKETRDFFIDIPQDAESIVFCESLIDALSFREIDENCGFVALTGAAKTRQVDTYIRKNKNIFKEDRKSTRLNSSHVSISYAVFCLTSLHHLYLPSFPTRRSSDLETRDFFIDIPQDAESIVFCESLIDALSFREIDENCGFVALTGAAKTRQVDTYIRKNKNIFK